MKTRKGTMAFCAVGVCVALAGLAQAGSLGDPVITNQGGVDGWRSNLIIDEGRSYVNATPWPKEVSLATFNLAVGNNRSRVTPFVVRLNDLNGNKDYTDDNNFTIVKIGTTRASGADYNATGVFAFPFDAGGAQVITLGPGEAIGAAFIDANPDGGGGGAGSVIPMNGSVPSGQQWYNGTGGDPHPSPPAPLTEGLTFGGGPSAGVQNRNYEFNIDYSLPPQRIEIAGDGVIGTDDLPGTEQNVTIGPPLPGAKYVRLRQNLNETFQIAEVQAFQTGTGINVAEQAQGGVATATTSGYSTNPGKANDGSTAGNHPNEWHSTDRVGATLTITLATPTSLDSVHFWGRTDCCHNRQDDFNLIISDASDSVIFDQQVLGLGSSPGRNGNIPVGLAVSGEVLATLNDADTYVFEVEAGGNSDQLVVPNPQPGVFTTILDLNDATLEVELATPPSAGGDAWTLLVADQFLGSFDSMILPDLGADYYYDTSGLLTDGSLALRVPEPATLVLGGLALAGLAGYVRRRRA